MLSREDVKQVVEEVLRERDEKEKAEQNAYRIAMVPSLINMWTPAQKEPVPPEVYDFKGFTGGRGVVRRVLDAISKED